MRGVLGILLLALAVSPSSLAAETSAFVDKTVLEPGESVRLTVSTTGSDASVDVSAIRDFRVISSGTSTNVQIVNGRVSRSIAYDYTLIPQRTGRLIIPKLSVLADGKTYQTREIIVTVSQRPKGRETDQAMFVDARVSNRHPYEGEQLIYTFRFYHRVQVSNPRFQKPSFSAFTAKETGDFRSYPSVVSGKRYTVSEIAYVLIPLKTGQNTIEPATLRCEIVKPKKRRSRFSFDSFFDDPFFGSADLEPKVLQTEAIGVDVRPLPAVDSGDSFSGLVGEFSLSARLDTDTLHVGESTTLSITIEGRGNIMDAEEPGISVPKALKVYKDSPEDDIQLTTTGYLGKKVFRTALVPVEAGEYVLSPIRLSYFDASAGEYRTRSTSPFSLEVLPSKEEEPLDVFPALEPQGDRPTLKKRVKLTGRDILPLNEGLDALTDEKPLSLPLFIVMLIAPALAHSVIRLIEKTTRRDNDPTAQMATRAAKSLRTADRSRDSSEVFLTSLYRALVSIILSKAGVAGESLTYAEAKETLRAHGYDDETGERAAQLLEQIESAKFSGAAMDDPSKQDLYVKTQALLKHLS